MHTDNNKKNKLKLDIQISTKTALNKPTRHYITNIQYFSIPNNIIYIY